MQRREIIIKFVLALASTVFLLISGVVLPAVGMIMIPFVPQPVLFFGLKYGTGLGVAVLVAALVILLVFAGEALGFIYSIFAVMVGLLFWLLGRLRAVELLVTAVAAAMLAAAAGVLLHFYGSWGAMTQDFRGSLIDNLTVAMRVHEKMGFPQESLNLFRERIPEIVEQMLQLLPGLLFVCLSLVVLLNVIVLWRRFPDRRTQWLSVATFREWKCPEQLVWALIGCGFVFFVPANEAVTTVAVNVLLVTGVCYFIQGLAIVAFFFHKSNVPRFLRSATYILIVFQQIFTLLVAALGLFDLWGDFRRLKKKNLNPSQAS
ncbi:MAG TPA: DUF2232 domain-containing protein [Candidatus Binatia bacterium]|nr:DUF2232 domain-containing protein [Candidatus Binatia bacterium]